MDNKIGIVLTLYDQATSKLKNIAHSMDELRQTSERFGRSALMDGAVVGAGLYKATSAFSDLEDASTRLRVTMMDKNGLTGAFQQVNALGVKLGNELPGTSADFLNMMATLKQFGITDASILGGVGEATAKIGVLMKMAPDAAAEFAAKMKTATGTADNDMLGLMDTIQRVYHQGVSATEMMYAFARSGGALKNFDIQGLNKSKELAPIFAQMIKGGLSGETVGTGFASVLSNLADGKKMKDINGYLSKFKISLQFFDKKGNFIGPAHMVAELDKLRGKLKPQELQAVLKHLTGGGQDAQMLATIIHDGLEGYQKMTADMEKQASLQKRVNEQLGTLKNLWDAASGTFTNALASFIEKISPQLKALTNWFGELSVGIVNFTNTHPTLTKWLGLAALGFVGSALGLGSLALAFAGVSRYISLAINAFAGLRIATLFLMSNPIIAAVALLALAALMIYKNWAPIKEFFINLWSGIKDGFSAAVDWIIGKFTSFVNWFGGKVKALSDMMPDWMKKYTLPGMVVDATSKWLAPEIKMGPTATGTANAPKQNIGGTLNIKIDSEGRARVASMKPNNPLFGFNVDSGYIMQGG